MGIALEDFEVVIVDDNPGFAKVLQMTLRGHFGFSSIRIIGELDDAISSFAGLDATSRSTPFIFFVDYHFPNTRTGTEFLRVLDENQLLDSSLAFLITSEPTVDKLKEAKKVGALGVIAKPFDRKNLEEQLDKARRVLLQRDVESF